MFVIKTKEKFKNILVVTSIKKSLRRAENNFHWKTHRKGLNLDYYSLMKEVIVFQWRLLSLFSTFLLWLLSFLHCRKQIVMSFCVFARVAG